MRNPYERDYTWIYWAFGLTFLGLLLSWMIYQNWIDSNACEARGGYWYCAYKSTCLCLAKGTVLQ